MGIVGQACENMQIKKYVVSPNEDDLYSTTADGILLTNFSGKVSIQDCVIDRSIDDAISIHGFYTKVEQITARNKAVVRLIHKSQAGTNIYFNGDVLKVSDGNSMNEIGTVKVKDTSIHAEPELIYLEFAEDIQNKIKIGDYLENDGRTPEVEIKNCLFNDFPAIRLSSAKKMIFENNIVKKCFGIKINDLMAYWFVSGCVTGLTIRLLLMNI